MWWIYQSLKIMWIERNIVCVWCFNTEQMTCWAPSFRFVYAVAVEVVAAIAAWHYYISNENQFFPSADHHFLLILRFFSKDPLTNCILYPFVSVSFFCSTPIWFFFTCRAVYSKRHALAPSIPVIWISTNKKYMGIDDSNTNERATMKWASE